MLNNIDFYVRNGTQAAINSLALLTYNQGKDLDMADEDVAERVFVYKITCNTTGKIYVGITARTPEFRWQQHVQHGMSGRLNTPLYAAIREYGRDNFTLECVGETKTRKEAGELEKKFVAEYDCVDPKGFNRTSGGEPGTRWSDSARQKASESKKGIPWTEEKRQVMAITQCTPEYRAKMRAARAKRDVIVVTDEQKQKISKSLAEHYKDPDARRKSSERATLLMSDPERRRNASIKTKEKFENPEYVKRWKEKLTAATSNPEYKANQCAAAAKRMADPELRKRISDAVKRRHAEGAYPVGWNTEANRQKAERK